MTKYGGDGRYTVTLIVCSSHSVQLKLKAVTVYVTQFCPPSATVHCFKVLYVVGWFMLLADNRKPLRSLVWMPLADKMSKMEFNDNVVAIYTCTYTDQA